MAIIRCPGCKRRVSSRAATCAGCGTPIAGATAGQGRPARRSNGRQNARRLRIQLLVALTLFVIGGMWLISANLRGAGGTALAAGLAAIGLLWYLGVRLLLWLRQR
jgi:hypothetical protein